MVWFFFKFSYFLDFWEFSNHVKRILRHSMYYGYFLGHFEWKFVKIWISVFRRISSQVGHLRGDPALFLCERGFWATFRVRSARKVGFRRQMLPFRKIYDFFKNIDIANTTKRDVGKKIRVENFPKYLAKNLYPKFSVLMWNLETSGRLFFHFFPLQGREWYYLTKILLLRIHGCKYQV